MEPTPASPRPSDGRIAGAGECVDDFRGVHRHDRPAGDGRTAEEWARDVFEGASLPMRVFLVIGWRAVLGLRLGARRDGEHVLGWRLDRSSDYRVVLRQDSWLITAANVVEVDDASVGWTTSVHYRRPLARLVWALVLPAHSLTIPWRLRRAARARQGM